MTPSTKNNGKTFAYLCHEFPKITETFVYKETIEISKLGYDVRVFSMKRSANPAAVDGMDRLVSMTTYFPPDFSVDLLMSQIKWFLKKPAAYLKELFYAALKDAPKSNIGWKARIGMVMRGALFASILEKEKRVRMFHVAGTGHELIAGHTAGALTAIPYGFTLHAPTALYSKSPLLGIHARDAHWIASISKDAKERLIGIAGEVIRVSVAIVHCGIGIRDYPPVENRAGNKIIGVGSLIDRKGHDTLIEALAVLLKRGIDASLVIAGAGPEKGRLEALAEKHGIGKNVALLGGKRPAEISQLLRASAVFCQPCRVDSAGNRDGVPVAIMEAMATGLPCVSTNLSGIPELIEDGISGILVAPDNPEQLADALQKILENKPLADSLGAEARKKIEREFTLEGQGAKLVELVESKIKDL